MNDATKDRMVKLNQRTFDKTEVFQKDILPRIQDLAILCKKHGIPLLMVTVPKADGSSFAMNLTQIEYPGTLSDDLALSCLLIGGKVPADATASFLDLIYKLEPHQEENPVDGCTCDDSDDPACPACEEAFVKDASEPEGATAEEFPLPMDKESKDGSVKLN